jgi:hypothetical protein
VDEAGHKVVPADNFVPAESERHAGREVGEAGHKVVPADNFVPAESEPHADGEVGERGVLRNKDRHLARLSGHKWLEKPANAGKSPLNVLF